MKILWVVNLMLPEIAKKLGKPYSVREGWLTGLFTQLTDGSAQLSIAYPVTDTDGIPIVLTIKNIKCYSFKENLNTPEVYDPALETQLRQIMEEAKPDLLHIFGTEFPHALAAARVFGSPDRTLLGIQGLCGKIAEDYFANLPEQVIKSRTFRDVVRHDSLLQQQEKFRHRAEHEAEVVRLSGHITGRTSFDYDETARLNPARRYHLMNETMRPEFYDGKWSLNNIRYHSIFIGQGDYPIKGLHFLLAAAGRLLPDYPDLQLLIAGNDILHRQQLYGQPDDARPGTKKTPAWLKQLKENLKRPAYGSYLCSLINRAQLDCHIRMLGGLSAEEMKAQYLQSAVYVCPSYVENSPNTVAEAMLLGMPVVASKSCGIPDMISEKEGFLFERGDEEALAEAIRTVFTLEEERAASLQNKCDAAYERAYRTHDGDTNYRRLLEIYDEIV